MSKFFEVNSKVSEKMQGEANQRGMGGGGSGDCGAELAIGYQLWGYVIGRGLRFYASNKDQVTRMSKGRLATMN